MSTPPSHSRSPGENRGGSPAGGLIFAWLFVGLPLAWGVIQTLVKAMALFR